MSVVQDPTLLFAPIVLGLSFACAGTRTTGSDIEANGTLLSSLTDIDIISVKEQLAVGIVRGEEDIRLVRWANVLDSSERITGPSGCSSPVNVATGDVDLDGRTDVLVFDSACGNWIALQRAAGSLTPAEWKKFLPDVTTNHYLYFEDLNADGDPDIASANATLVRGWSRKGREWISFSASIEGPTLSNPSVTDSIIIHGSVDGEHVLAFSKGGEFSIVASERLEGELIPLGASSQRGLELLLKPYEAYDQLQSIDANGCGGLAIGVGLFPSSPDFPRHLVSLDFTLEGFFFARLIATAYENVLSVAFGEFMGNIFVGAVSRSGTKHAFELMELNGCSWERVAGPYDIGFHPMCSSTPSGSQSCAGERLVASVDQDELTFLHFGGRWLDKIIAHRSDDTWEIKSNAMEL